MRSATIPSGKTLALLVILLCFVLGSFGISLAHDPTAPLAPLEIIRASQAPSLTQVQYDRSALGLAIVAEIDGAHPLNASSARVEHCFTKPGGSAATFIVPSLRVPKVSLEIINSALQI